MAAAAAAAALAAAEAIINNIPAAGYQNGTDYVNNAVPSTSHVTAVSRWRTVTAAGGGPNVFEGLQASICYYARVDGDTAERNAVADADKMDIECAVVVAIARAAFARLYGLTTAQVSVAESEARAHGDAAPTVHADHAQAVADALSKWAEPAARYMSLAFYNAISVETCAHNHLPAKTKKLWTTTRDLLRIKEWLDAHAGRENYVAHDMFHPLSDTVKSDLARSTAAKKALVNLKMGNLAKRIPVKAADTGIAMNYPTLISKARGYPHTPDVLPTDLNSPKQLTDAIDEYVNAADANAAADAVAKLQRMSTTLEEASAYLVGFILGRDARSSDNPDLTIDEAKGVNTILGSPAYTRAAGQFPGTFSEGKRRGWTTLSRFSQKAATDHLAPRLAGVVAGINPARNAASAAQARAVEEREAHRTAESAAAAAATAAAAGSMAT